MSGITLDMPEELTVGTGDYLRSEAGSCWFVNQARTVCRREPAPGRTRWKIDAIRVPAGEVPDDARIYEFFWYPRGRR